ncbi:MAG: hypothetical protein IJ309_02005 [Clostridia bacterium]|nr:hypothetical protein [Clostridia bacterium]
MLRKIIDIVSDVAVGERLEREERIRQNENTMTNRANRGLIRHASTPIEAYLAKDRLEKVVISGENSQLRNRVMCASAYNATRLGFGSVIIHCGNKELEELLTYAYSDNPSRLILINEENPVYDPFVGLDRDQLSRFVVRSTVDRERMPFAGGMYMKGLYDFLEFEGAEPRAELFCAAPHEELVTGIENHLREIMFSRGGTADDNSTINNIIHELTTGREAQGEIKSYFDNLHLQARHILASKDISRQRITSIHSALRQGKTIAIDIFDSRCSQLINIIVQELDDTLNDRYYFNAIFDSLPDEASLEFSKFIHSPPRNCGYVYSVEDISASVSYDQGGGVRDVFADADNLIILRHGSTSTGEHLRNYFSTYSHTDINRTTTHNRSYSGPGNILTKHTDAEATSEVVTELARIDPAYITRLRTNEALIKRKNDNNIIVVDCAYGTALSNDTPPLTGEFEPTQRERENAIVPVRRVNWFLCIFLMIVCYPAGCIYLYRNGTPGQRVASRIIAGVLTTMIVLYIVLAIVATTMNS